MTERAIERLLVLGPAGSYLDGLAGSLHLDCPTVFGSTFPEMIELARNQSRTAVLLPIKNTLDGQLYANVGAFQGRDLRVVGAATLEVVSNIMGLGTLDDAKYIAGKDVALGQITGYMPHLERRPMTSTSAAGQYIQESGDTTTLAVGSVAQVRHYGLTLLDKAVQDEVGVNETTVLIARGRNGWKFDPAVAETDTIMSGTMIMRTRNSGQADSLRPALGEMADRGINLTTIESLSIRGTHDSEFFLTFTGVGRAIADLATSQDAAEYMSMDILGVYNEPQLYAS